jgi:Flp pilus assembly protein TadD
VTKLEVQLRDHLTQRPSDSEALRELAELVSAERHRKGEAVELWQRYVEAVHADRIDEALLCLARAQVEARREADAIMTLERCTAEDIGLGEALELLGELLRRAGRFEDAVSVLQRAAELDDEAVQPRLALVACFDALERPREAEAALESVRALGQKDPAIAALVRELVQRRG